jgi:hypothetical protein
MKSINELLGFAVLTGPLWLILLVLIVGIWIVVKLVRRFKPGVTRFAVGLGIFLLVFCVPFADEIAGRIYFNHLCATEAGVKVYHTVELPSEYWDEKGRPKFFNEHGYLDHDFWVKELDESGGHVGRYSSVFSIDKDTSPVKERTSQKALAEVTTFRFWGGWVSRNFSPNNTAASCEFLSAPNFSRNFYGQLFKPATSTR